MHTVMHSMVAGSDKYVFQKAQFGNKLAKVIIKYFKRALKWHTCGPRTGKGG